MFAAHEIFFCEAERSATKSGKLRNFFSTRATSSSKKFDHQ
jgi:hypothetical protein